MQRKFEAGDVADRLVLPAATNASKPRRKPHHNAALVRGLRDNELRACYRATFKEDPGQMGKDKILRPVRLAEDCDAHRRRTRKPNLWHVWHASKSARLGELAALRNETAQRRVGHS